MPLKKPAGLALNIAPLERKPSFHISETGTFCSEDLVLGARGIATHNAAPAAIQFGDIRIGGMLGEGASSKVYRAVHTPSGLELAIKVLKEEVGANRESRQMMFNEVRLVYSAQSDHLVKFFDAFFNQGYVYLAFEWMDLGSLEVLYRLIAASPYPLFDEAVMAQTITQIAQGLAYLHKERHAVHRDLKPANVLVNSHGCVKLSDFGISKELGSTQGLAGTQCGTTTYMSPERITGHPYSYPADIWSLGLIILEGMCNGYPFPTLTGIFDVHQHIVQGPLPTERPEVQQRMPADLLELVTATLQKDPAHRIEVLSILRAPFITRHRATPSDLGRYFTAFHGQLRH